MVNVGLSISSIFRIFGTEEVVNILTSSYLFLGFDFWKTCNVDVNQEPLIINYICFYMFYSNLII